MQLNIQRNKYSIEDQTGWNDGLAIPKHIFCPKCNHDMEVQRKGAEADIYKRKPVFTCYYQCQNERCKEGEWITFNIAVRHHPLSTNVCPLLQFKMLDSLDQVTELLGGEFTGDGDKYFDKEEFDPVIRLTTK